MLIHIVIAGTTPLLMNKFTDEAAMQATSATRLSTAGHRGSPQEQAEKKIYLGLEGNPMIPQPNLFRCLIDAGAYFKANRSKITTQKSSLLPACVDISGAEIPLSHVAPWRVDTRAVRIPATGGRILCHRPCFEDWSLAFDAEIDTDMIQPGLFREIVDCAGKRIGLGDFRPATKGPFGKFVVTLWDVAKTDLHAAA